MHNASEAWRTAVPSRSGDLAGTSVVDQLLGRLEDWVAPKWNRQPSVGKNLAGQWTMEVPSRGAGTEVLEMLDYRIAESYVQRYHMLAHGRTGVADEPRKPVRRGWERLLSSDEDGSSSIEFVAILGEN